MALPHGATGSLSPGFPPARRVCLAVKHPYAYALVSAITDRAEGTLGRLRYSFGGDRPSQTAFQTMSPAWFHRSELEFRLNQGGISTTTLPELAPRRQSLPPILHKQN